MSYTISFDKIMSTDAKLFDDDAPGEASSYLFDEGVLHRLSEALEDARNEVAKRRENDQD
jgi:hypothetical protein